MDTNTTALEAIQKKLLGKKLTYQEIYTIMDDISQQRLGDILTTYFAASGYSHGFTEEELFFLTKAMVETGEKLHFSSDIVADKHSIGGVPGTRTTMIIVPIVAAAGFIIPKSSSRAITTPGGTADDMEVLADVELSIEQIYKIVEKTNGCIVWGGGVNIAPADDIIITVEKPLLFESLDKVLVSIMAKKIAFGATHLVIDLPMGETMKVHSLHDAEILKRKFEYLAKRFGINIKVLIHKTDEPVGQGVGPLLETRAALRVLQQKDNRPIDLEIRSLHLAGTLLDMCLADSPKELRDQVKKEFGNGIGWATHILQSGVAFTKMREIIAAQGGKAEIDSEDLHPGKYSLSVYAKKSGKVRKINSKEATIITKILGAPQDKKAGIYLEHHIGDKLETKDILYTIYSSNEYNLKEAQESLAHFPIFAYE